MKPDSMVRTEKIIAEIRTRTCIDKIEVLKEILQDELNECYEIGYSAGYSEGYSEGHSEVKTLLKMR